MRSDGIAAEALEAQQRRHDAAGGERKQQRQAEKKIGCGGQDDRRWRSDAADIGGARRVAAAALYDALAAIEGGAAVIAVMAGNVVPVAVGISGSKPAGGIADDGA